MFGFAVEVSKVLDSGETYKNNPLIWDTGSSFGMTTFRSDFIDYVEADIPVKDVTKVNGVIAVGTTINNILYLNVHDCYLPCVS